MSLTDRDRKIVFAILPLLLLAVYWFLVLSPKRKEAKKLGAQVTQAQQARDAAVSTANSLEQAKANFPVQYAQMVRLGKAIPTQVDMPSLIVQLDAAAHGTGIQVGDIKVGARVAAAPVTTTAPTTPSTGTTAPPVAAGGAQAQTSFGQAAESANNAAAQGNAQAIQQSGLSADDASTSTASKSGGLPVGGGTSVTPTAITPGQPVPGLDTVPLTFTFGGKFTNLSNFFHRLKRFVHVANNRINVHGRLITIDSLKFTSTAANFPNIQADVTATVYLSPKDGGTTAGATAAGPATTTPGTSSSQSTAPEPSTPAPSSSATAAVTPPTSAITR
ncbi:MAG TPA: type 4a pilus biogenesis protein PilO [Thermoleophilaceae bacterium]